MGKITNHPGVKAAVERLGRATNPEAGVVSDEQARAMGYLYVGMNAVEASPDPQHAIALLDLARNLHEATAFLRPPATSDTPTEPHSGTQG